MMDSRFWFANSCSWDLPQLQLWQVWMCGGSPLIRDLMVNTKNNTPKTKKTMTPTSSKSSMVSPRFHLPYEYKRLRGSVNRRAAFPCLLDKTSKTLNFSMRNRGMFAHPKLA